MSKIKAADLPRTVEFHYSWMATLFAAIFLGAASLWAAWIIVLCLLSGHVLSYIGAAILLAVSIPLLLPLWVRVLHAWSFREPVVIFDEHGVTDIRQPDRFIAWEDIGRITLGVGESYSFLCFQFRNRETTRQHLGPLYLPRMFFRRVSFLSDWSISLRLLRCSRSRVLNLAKAFHRRSISEKITEINRAQIVNPRAGRA